MTTNSQKEKNKKAENKFHINSLNEMFISLTPKQRLEKIYTLYDPKEILFTSSFGINSGYLLHLLSEINSNQEIHFINTGYLFQETLSYLEELKTLYKLNIKEVNPLPKEHNLTSEQKWWKSHPKMCCSINKIAPLERVKKGKKIWISGVLAFQTEFRSNLSIFAPHKDLIKFHPLIDLLKEDLLLNVEKLKIPKHPLSDFGYGSIGCLHCTTKGIGREGRWKESEKTECGLHTL